MPVAKTSVAASASIYGGASQWRRADVKAMRAEKEKRSMHEVKDFGLDRRAAYMEKLGMEVEVDGKETECRRGIACWLW